MKANEIIDNAKNAVAYFNNEIAEMFPDYMVKAIYKDNMGPHIIVEFYNVASKDEAPNKILMNTDFMKLIIHLYDGAGRVVDMDKFSVELVSWGHRFKPNNIKYRKINGKSPMDAMDKLIKWFAKNEDAIMLLENSK